MLSDEEKKAIVELKHYSSMTAYWKQEEYTNSEIDNYIKIVLNIVEKQSKEIERLEARKYMFNAETGEISQIPIDNNYISKDKIEAKIEEINKEMLNEENSLELFYRKKYCKEVLQSLLEKE